MKAELFIRMYHLQEEKLDVCLEYLERVSKIFVDNIETIPDSIKDEFISITQPFINKYNELLGTEGEYVEEEKE
jgi:hypothetical protein